MENNNELSVKCDININAKTCWKSQRIQEMNTLRPMLLRVIPKSLSHENQSPKLTAFPGTQVNTQLNWKQNLILTLILLQVDILDTIKKWALYIYF